MSKVSRQLREKISLQAKNRCGYCLLPERIASTPLEIEHLHPTALGGSNDEENLWLACRLCNGYKNKKTHGRDSLTQKRVKLFNPRLQNWKRHFKWNHTKTEILGKTACGRVTVEALKLNNNILVSLRALWGEKHLPPFDDD